MLCQVDLGTRLRTELLGFDSSHGLFFFRPRQNGFWSLTANLATWVRLPTRSLFADVV